MNFTNAQYKEKALNAKKENHEHHTSTDAFLLLLRGLEKENLSNLCEMIHVHYSNLPNPIILSLDDCYKLTQKENLTNLEKQTIFNLSINCINRGKHLGNKTINDGKINTSSWITHCFYAGEVCETLAKQFNLDTDKAKTFGFLHDFGRKVDHSFAHTIKGFEALTDMGWNEEAISCLTHSFVNGGRCSNNEPAIEGFYVDENGFPKWNKNTKKDDVTLFLENYQYTEYDILLTIADLMATDKGIVSPKKRIADIATRRIIDPTNRGYFLADITNTFIMLLRNLELIDNTVKYIKADKNTSLETIQNYFDDVSEYFFSVFQDLYKKNKTNEHIKK